jgi:NAD(P)-dependent dehydrogenase (short-subunit alcohol dehydrogenase family)
VPTVLITGCSSGIGAATALKMREAGWTVYATARRLESLESLVQAGARALALDVTKDMSMRTAVAAIEREQGHIDALVNNAAYSQSGPLEEVPIELVRTQFETNVFGLLRLTQLVLPGMRRAKSGRIVNIGSMGGRLTFPGGGVYHASKHALVALNDALRFEVQGFGIDVILIEPGLIRTGFADVALASLDRIEHRTGPYAHFIREVGRITSESYEKGPLRRLTGTPEDVANAVHEALTAQVPKTRYRVARSARFFLALRALLSDRRWDRFMRRTYPTPGQ